MERSEMCFVFFFIVGCVTLEVQARQYPRIEQFNFDELAETIKNLKNNHTTNPPPSPAPPYGRRDFAKLAQSIRALPRSNHKIPVTINDKFNFDELTRPITSLQNNNTTTPHPTPAPPYGKRDFDKLAQSFRTLARSNHRLPITTSNEAPKSQSLHAHLTGDQNVNKSHTTRPDSGHSPRDDPSRNPHLMNFQSVVNQQDFTDCTNLYIQHIAFLDKMQEFVVDAKRATVVPDLNMPERLLFIRKIIIAHNLTQEIFYDPENNKIMVNLTKMRLVDLNLFIDWLFVQVDVTKLLLETEQAMKDIFKINYSTLLPSAPEERDFSVIQFKPTNGAYYDIG